MRNYRVFLIGCFAAIYLLIALVELSFGQNVGNAIMQPNTQAAQQQAAQQQAAQQQAAQQQAMQRQAAEQMQQPVANPAGAAANGQPQSQMGNAPFAPLEPAYQKYLDDVLGFWQLNTSKIDRFACKFKRWEFNPTIANDPKEFYSASYGTIRYMKPDKGMYQVEEIQYRVTKPDGTIKYEATPGQFGDWWICDGEKVHEYDRTLKKVTKYPLPPNMRGTEVFNSPLPFVFGVEAEKVKQRFWMRPLPPPMGQDGKPNENLILIEAYPKYASDAVNYHHVTIYLDKTEFLPQAIEIALTQWTPQAPHREFFEFIEREKDNSLLAKIKENVFRQAFIPEAPPKDWTVEERAMDAIPVSTPEPANPNDLRAANPGTQPPNGVQR
jgi:TIGR03009 family protein